MGMTIIETRRNFKKSKDFFRFLNFFGNIHQFRRIYEIDEYFYMNIITISSQTYRVLISNYSWVDLINNIYRYSGFATKDFAQSNKKSFVKIFVPFKYYLLNLLNYNLKMSLVLYWKETKYIWKLNL